MYEAFSDFSSCLSTKRSAHEPSLTATKAVKRDIGTSAGATSCPHAWLDAAKEAIQRGAEWVQAILRGPTGHGASTAKVVAAGPTPLVEAIPMSSREEAGVGDATSMAMLSTVSDLLRAIPDTPDATQGSEAVTVEEAGPSVRPGGG